MRLEIIRIDDPYAQMGSSYDPEQDVFRQKEADDEDSRNHDKPGVPSDKGVERGGQDDLGRSGEIPVDPVCAPAEDGSASDAVPTVDAGRPKRKARTSAWED